MAGIFDNWGRPAGSSPSFASGFPVSSPAAAMSNWGMGITAPEMFAPTPVGAVDVVPRVPGAMGGVGSGGILGGGSFMDKAQLGLSALGTVGSLWGAFQAAKLAKQQFKYTKDVTETNLANQLKSYNTQLTDRANNRAIVEGKTAEQTAAYIDANKLSRYGTRG